MQIQLGKTLDVEVVERHLAELWQETARGPEVDTAVLRARVANLLVYVSSDAELAGVHEMLSELTSIHPCRALLMRGAPEAPDRDIEMSLESICQTDKRTGAKRLTCEEIIFKAEGKFVAELPSAALPLLAPDLSTFLWWRSAPHVSDKVFDRLLRAVDRLIIDSDEFPDPQADLSEVHRLFTAECCDQVGISDLNWARLTFWRELLADFYDVAAYRARLDGVRSVEIDYVAPELDESAVAPQAFLFSGWLAGRLGWTLSGEPSTGDDDQSRSFKFATGPQGSGAGEIQLTLKRIERRERKPGRLVRVELRSSLQGPAAFSVVRSEDNLSVLAEAKLGTKTVRGRVLPVRNRSAARLLSREMEILCNDQIYQEALAIAAKMIDRSITLS